MKKIFTALYILVLFQTCNNIDGANSKANKTFNVSRNIESFKVYEFKIDNKNVNQIGYQVWPDDEHIGVKAILIQKQFVYVTDVYHNNVKRINIETGELFSSSIIDSISGNFNNLVWLRDLTFFNDKIYVTSDRKKIYVLNKHLDKESELSTIVGRKYIFSQTADSLKIFLEGKQMKDLKMQNNFLLVTADNRIKNISEYISLDKYKSSLEQLSINGKPYEILTKDTKEYIKTEFGIIELKSKIPQIINYDCFNIQFTNDILVYFDSTPDKFILYVYKLK